MILEKSRFFSGFCFVNEQELFSEYLENRAFVVSGFSKGAIKAFEYVLNLDSRVDLLQLFSPAFFQNKDEKFKRVQLISFKKDEDSYIKNFLENATFGSSKDIKSYFQKGDIDELEELLYYTWSEEKIKKLLNKGTKIELYLGAKDKIVDTSNAYDFFKNFAEVYYIKDVGHIL